LKVSRLDVEQSEGMRVSNEKGFSHFDLREGHEEEVRTLSFSPGPNPVKILPVFVSKFAPHPLEVLGKARSARR
jgi:hypothetical protein